MSKDIEKCRALLYSFIYTTKLIVNERVFFRVIHVQPEDLRGFGGKLGFLMKICLLLFSGAVDKITLSFAFKLCIKRYS